MAEIKLYTESTAQLWANDAARKNLKKIINNKNAIVDANGFVNADGSKRICFAKMIHKFQMNNSSSYREKQINKAVVNYNAQADVFNKKNALPPVVVKTDELVKALLADKKALEGKISSEQKKINDAEAKISLHGKELAAAKASHFAPVKATEAKRDGLINDLTQAGLTTEILTKRNELTKESLGLVKENSNLDVETNFLKNQNSQIKGMYLLPEVWYYNQDGDKIASEEKINASDMTNDQKAQMKSAVFKVIDNDERLAAIVARKKEISNRQIDISVQLNPLNQAIESTLQANKATFISFANLNNATDIGQELVTFENQIQAQKANLANTANFSVIEGQINAAKSAKTTAVAQLIELQTKLGNIENDLAAKKI